MQIGPYCQRQKCSTVNVLSSNIRVMQIFAEVQEIWGVKQESGRLRFRFSYLSLAIFSKSSSPRLKSATHSICVKLLHKHDKLTQCCCAFTLALARLSCLYINTENYDIIHSLQNSNALKPTLHIISALFSISIAIVSGYLINLLPSPTVGLCVCVSGKCTVTKRLIGSGCDLG